MEVRRLTPEDAAVGHFVASGMIPGVPAAQVAAGLWSPEHPSSVKVDGKVAVFVALQNAPAPLAPVERTLEQIVKCVAGIVPRFDARV
jgi:hypothetical protein